VVDKANILALASHDMVMIQKTCNKVLWLEHGVVKQFGPPAAVVQAYKDYVAEGGERAPRINPVDAVSKAVSG
jgi:ABC-type polysaccharide/polyol phosphate transport system ATPase subunit